MSNSALIPEIRASMLPQVDNTTLDVTIESLENNPKSFLQAGVLRLEGNLPSPDGPNPRLIDVVGIRALGVLKPGINPVKAYEKAIVSGHFLLKDQLARDIYYRKRDGLADPKEAGYRGMTPIVGAGTFKLHETNSDHMYDMGEGFDHWQEMRNSIEELNPELLWSAEKVEPIMTDMDGFTSGMLGITVLATSIRWQNDIDYNDRYYNDLARLNGSLDAMNGKGSNNGIF